MAALAVAGPPLSFGARPVQPRSAGITGAFGLGALRRLVSRSTTRGSRRSERAGASPSFAAAGLLAVSDACRGSEAAAAAAAAAG
jgi:hypothetical protein